MGPVRPLMAGRSPEDDEVTGSLGCVYCGGYPSSESPSLWFELLRVSLWPLR